MRVSTAKDSSLKILARTLGVNEKEQHTLGRGAIAIHAGHILCRAPRPGQLCSPNHISGMELLLTEDGTPSNAHESFAQPCQGLMLKVPTGCAREALRENGKLKEGEMRPWQEGGGS